MKKSSIIAFISKIIPENSKKDVRRHEKKRRGDYLNSKKM